MVDEDLNNIESEDFPELVSDLDTLPQDSKLYTQHVLNIPRYVKFTLSTLGLTQSDLAAKLNKTEAEISKWLSGKQNITLRTISKLEAALPIHIINPEIKRLIETLRHTSHSNMIYPTLSFNANSTFNVFILDNQICKVERAATLTTAKDIKVNQEFNLTLVTK
jgi:transcriptional regulator with XRE-family HTH domain